MFLLISAALILYLINISSSFNLILKIFDEAFYFVLHSQYRFVFTPLQRLKSAAISLSRGIYEFKLKPTSDDKMGKVTHVFTDMMN